MALKPDQERVKTLLRDTITLLCKNGLEFQNKFSLEALIGVTVDEGDVFLLSINELIKSDRYVEYVPTQGKSPGSPAQKRRKRARRSSEDVKKQSPDAAPPKIAREISDDDVDNVESDQGDPDLVYVKQEAVEDPGDWNVVQTVAGSSGTSYTQPVTVSSVPQVHDETFEAVGDLLSAQDMQDGDWVEQGEGTSGQQQFNTSTATITLPGQGEEGGEQPQQQVAAIGMLSKGETSKSYGKVEVVVDEVTKQKKRICRHEGCSFESVHRSTMLRHQRRHFQSFFPCPKCTKKFVERYDLNSHIRSVHDKDLYVCNYCGKFFRTRSGLNCHERKHRPAEEQVKFLCSFCPEIFGDIETLANHISEHTKSSEAIEVVVETEVNEEKRVKPDKVHAMYHCPDMECSFTSLYRSSMSRHKRRCHSKTSLSCDICDKTYIEKFDLRLHKQTAHSNIRYHCERCNKSFKYKSTLVAHKKKKCTCE